MTEPFFSTVQVTRLVGISYRQADYWARIHLIRPSIADARGSGSQRHYSRLDLIHFTLIRQLLDNGVSLQRAREALKVVDDLEAMAGMLFLVDDHARIGYTASDIMNALKTGRGNVVSVVDLGALVADLDRRILEMLAAAS